MPAAPSQVSSFDIVTKFKGGAPPAQNSCLRVLSMTYKITSERMYAETVGSGVVSRHMGTATNPDTNAASVRVAEHITSRDNRWLKQFRAALAGEPARASRASKATRPSDGTEALASRTLPALPHEPSG